MNIILKNYHVQIINGQPVLDFDTLLENIVHVINKYSTTTVKIEHLYILLRWVETDTVSVCNPLTDSCYYAYVVSRDHVISICIRLAIVFECYPLMNAFLKELKLICEEYYKDFKDWIIPNIQDEINAVRMRYRLFTRILEGTPYKYRGIYDSETNITWISDPMVLETNKLVFNQELRERKESKHLYKISHRLRASVSCDDVNVYVRHTDCLENRSPDLENLMYSIHLQEEKFIDKNIKSLVSYVDRCIYNVRSELDEMYKLDCLRLPLKCFEEVCSKRKRSIHEDEHLKRPYKKLIK